MKRAIKYRIYPTTEQRSFFLKTFGCCRKVWNLMLHDRSEAYRKDKTFLYPTPAMYKKDYPFLREVDSLALANVQLDLNEAFRRFFRIKGTRYPKYKSRKRARASYTTNNQNGTVSVNVDAGTIRLPKAGHVKAVLHRLPGNGWVVRSATVSMERDGTFYCSVLFETGEAPADPVPSPEQNAVGLDYKSDGLFVSSDGEVCGSPKFYRASQEQRTRAQRKLRHKRPGSRNYEKQKRRVAKVDRHTANQRKDFLHKMSTGIANRYDMVCVESLDMRAMSNRGFRNGKATMDNGYGMFLDMLDYKLADRGKVLIRVGKWFPSSQLCSCCGHRNPETKDLNVREWTCSVCGAHHDRDINAALNIKQEGTRQYTAG